LGISALGQAGTITSPEKDCAIDWLKAFLPTGTSMTSAEVLRLAKENGIKVDTLQRAKKKLKVVSCPLQQPDGKRAWFLRIPEEVAVKSEPQLTLTMPNIP
jgi:hypothetical protein